MSRVMERSPARLEKELRVRAAIDLVPLKRICTKCKAEKVMQRDFYWDRQQIRYRPDCKECVKRERRVPDAQRIRW